MRNLGRLMTMTVTALLLAAFAPVLAQSPGQFGAATIGPQLVVPVVADSMGVGGTHFRTDLTIRNATDSARNVQIDYYPAEGPQSAVGRRRVVVTLDARQTVTWEDVVPGLLHAAGLGALWIKGTTSDLGGDVGFDPNARLTASYRIYTKDPGGEGTVSLSSDALVLSDAFVFDDVALALGLRHDRDFRTNVGVVNLAREPRTFLISASGTSGRPVSMTLEVAAESMSQRPLPPGSLGETAVSVQLLNPDDSYGFWTAYGASVDNSTGDSWLQTAVPARETVGASRLLIPAHLNGVDGNGLVATTRLNVTNHSQARQDVNIGFTPSGDFCYGDVCSGTGFTLAPGSSALIVDGVGMLGLGGFGSINLNSATPALTATYRTSSVLPGRGSGTVGRTGEAIDPQTMPGDDGRRVAIGMRHDESFTCRVGIWAEWYGNRRFSVTATSDKGSVTKEVSVTGYSVAEVPLPEANLGFVTVTVEPLDTGTSSPYSDTKWTAYAISIDNSSGDSWLETAWPQ